ncbi:MAG: hypothetical protein AB1705_07955 [Verrucomicrobiota bacterium]
MEVLTAVLCDSAADYNGKLCILGAFDTIWVRRFPAAHPHCAIALRFLFRDTDEGKHKIAINLIDSDGRNMLPGKVPPIELDLQQIPEETFFLSRNFVVNLQGLPLNKPGQYSIDIVFDDSIVARIPLQLIQLKEGTGS